MLSGLSLTDFTTNDQIRAVLGVAESELPDAVLALSIYAQQLEFDLQDLSATLIAAYATLEDETDADSRTAAQELFFNCTQVFSAYSVAKVLVTNTGLGMFAPQEITDSKTTLRRKDPYADARAAVLAGWTIMRGRLLAAYAALAPGATVATAVGFVAMTKVSIAVDPVKGA